MFSVCSRMAIETLGEAFVNGWRITARCVHGREDGTHCKSSRECFYRKQLDIETLVWTRGVLSRCRLRAGCAARSVALGISSCFFSLQQILVVSQLATRCQEDAKEQEQYA